MSLGEDLTGVAQYTPEEFGDLRRHIDPAWLEAALAATGTATLRRRRLPAEQVIWLVIGMALLRRRSIVEVAAKLDLALPAAKPSAAPSSVAQARARVGDEPLAWLFGQTARAWAGRSAAADQWRGLGLYAVDGTKLWVPDTIENLGEFGKHSGGPGESAFPMVRMVTLMALRSHLIAAVRFGAYTKSETAYADELWELVPDESLVIVDRLYSSAATLLALSATRGRHWLTRGRSNLRYRVLEELGPNDFVVEMQLSPDSRAALAMPSKTWTARLVKYQRKGFTPQVLLTSMMDAKKYPAEELVTLYHERWEIEQGYDEIKTELLDGEKVLRSKTPTLVNQELWGILIAYNLVRLEMERVAEDAEVTPTQISFTSALHLVCDEWLWCAVASPGAIPRHLRNLRASLVNLVLPKRRSNRSYPRDVKVQRSNYARNRRSSRKPDVK